MDYRSRCVEQRTSQSKSSKLNLLLSLSAVVAGSAWALTSIFEHQSASDSASGSGHAQPSVVVQSGAGLPGLDLWKQFARPHDSAAQMREADAGAAFQWYRDECDHTGSVTRQMVGDWVVVTLSPFASEAQLAHLCADVPLSVHRKVRVPGAERFLVKFTNPEMYDQGVDYLQSFPSICAQVQPDFIFSASFGGLNDEHADQLWGLHNTGQTGGTADADIDAPEAWQLTTGSQAVVVGIIDSGVDYNHRDLAANMWQNAGEIGLDADGADKRTNGIDDDGNGYIDDYRGWDFIDNDNDPMDDWLHGTHVAGTVGAVGNNNHDVVGVAQHVQLMPIRAIDFFVNGGAGVTSLAAEGLVYAVDNGAHITTNSYGGQEYSEVMRDAIAYAQEHDVLFVASAGNESKDNDADHRFPSSYQHANIIAVAASDHDDERARFDQPSGLAGGTLSNIGAYSVDLAAPEMLFTAPTPAFRPRLCRVTGML